jgi:hypothetical protein
MIRIAGKDGQSVERDKKGPPKPRLLWLLGFQILIIALVVLMARATRGLTSPPLLEERLGPLSTHAVTAPIQEAFGGGRGWLAAVVAMVGALLLMLPVVWTYVATRAERKVDHSIVTTITLLPIAVAAILVIVQDSLAVAFSLAGIAGVVRFRNALEDTKDAMYVFGAIAVGLGAGVGALEASAALSVLFNGVVVALWKWNVSPPEIAEIALGAQPGSERQGDPQMPRVAEWLKPTEMMKLDSPKAVPTDGASKREGMLRVRTADDASTRVTVEAVLEQFAKRWTLESDDTGLDGAPTLTYQVRLNKRVDPEELLTALHQQLGPQDSYSRISSGSSPSPQG